MLQRSSVASVLLLAGTLWCAAAQATILEGSFSGIAFDSRIDAESPNPRDFDGQTVTGSFYFDTANLAAPEESSADFTWIITNPGSMKLVFHAAGQTAIFDGTDDDSPSVIASRRDAAAGPTLSLLPGYLSPYYNASLTLAGPLFDGVDIATAHPGPIDLAHSSASFFAGRSFGSEVRLTEVTFLSAVPEPQTWGLMGLGLAFISWRAMARGRANPA